ncbi:DUF7289 family protein [Haloparvum sp. PAK95]|uniref:DUF7289 family protein n=1 Tax=Haloparvum sp. PAK95 TaxID=3418962 RepID=UPI003D2F1381
MRCRGQSEVLGFILLLGLVTAGVTGVVVLGSEAVSDTRQSITSGTAEHAMTQFDSKASLVAHGDSSSQSATLAGSSSATRTVDPDRGWMNVTIRNESDSDQIEAQLMNVTLGAVVYEDGETTIAYQGGGVWRSDTGGSQMVSPPEFHYRGTTLTLPLVTVDGDGSVNEDVQITQNGPSENVYPNGSYSNPLENGKIVVEVHSEFYAAWARFFSERTGGEVTIDHENETATITLVTPAETEPVGAALSSSAAGDELELSGGGSGEDKQAYVDSYNSSGGGNYSTTKTGNGTVRAAGDVDMSGNAKILGNIRSGGSISLGGSANITRTAYWTTGFNVNGNKAEYGGEEQISGVEEANDVTPFVNNRLDSLAEDNDNAKTSAIDTSSGDSYLNFSGSDSVTLSADDGTRYHLNKIDADSKEIVIDTNGEEVEIAVSGGISLDGSTIRVEGDGVVRFYLDDDLSLSSGAEVTVPDERSEGMWMYGTTNTDVSMEGSSSEENHIRFVGVVYATGQSDFDVKHMDLYGGVIAGDMDVGNGGSIHYDEALETAQTLPTDAAVPRVTYLHISTTEIRVEND